MPGDIPARPDAGVGGLQLVGDHDLSGLAGLHPHGLEVEPLGDRAASERDEDLVGTELLLAARDLGHDDDLPGDGIAGNAGGNSAADHPDALVGEDFLQ